MARMYPDLSSDSLKSLRSRAEARFYVACRDQLDDQWLVIHSLPWIGLSPGGRRRDGETDFLIFHHNQGLLAVEVKGGRILFDPLPGNWFSIDRSGAKHPIRDPFQQATQEKHAALKHLRGSRQWRAARLKTVSAGHGVLLADVDDASSLTSLAEAPPDIVGARSCLQHCEQWLIGLAQFWRGKDSHSPPLGEIGMSVVREVFCEPRDVRPLVAYEIAEEEIMRIRLTEQQARLLRALGDRQRASVCGGAGTGKTLLAVQKARELSHQGNKTLLVCYNQMLSAHLRYGLRETAHLTTASYHQLCRRQVNAVAGETGRDLIQEAKRAYPDRDLYNCHLPYALATSTEILPERFDAIVVDEGQDFREDFWLPLEMLLSRSDSMFLIFYDHNQRFRMRSSSFPIVDPPFLLTTNCRNTRHIHGSAYRFFSGPDTDPPEIEGYPLSPLCAPTVPAQAKHIASAVTTLLTRHQVTPRDVAVLVMGTPKAFYYEELQSHQLPKPGSWSTETTPTDEGVRLDTVRRFKGLEAAFVFLWGPETADPDTYEESLYVGMSRAKSRLVVVGTEEGCARALRGCQVVPLDITPC